MADKGSNERVRMFVNKIKPYLAMVSLQFGYAGMYIISMVGLKRGMNHFVLATYRHFIAFAVIAPFALVLERFGFVFLFVLGQYSFVKYQFQNHHTHMS